MQLGWRARIGQIRPATTIESAEEWRSVAPPGVHFADARTIVPKVDAAGLRVMMSQVVDAAKQLATAHVDLIVQCGAPGIFLLDPDTEQQVTEQIVNATGIPALTMMQAMLDALAALGATNVAVATTYTEQVNAALATYLQSHGFKVGAMVGLSQDDPYLAGLEEPDSSYRLGRLAARQASAADAVLISCAGYRTFETLEYLERDTGLPVVSSNQAALWRALRMLGLRDTIPNLGRLFQIDG